MGDYGGTRHIAWNLLAQERERQEELARVGVKFSKTAFDAGLPECRKVCLLAEELGEVAELVNDGEEHGFTLDMRDDLLTELIQLAAIAIAWSERLIVEMAEL